MKARLISAAAAALLATGAQAGIVSSRDDAASAGLGRVEFQDLMGQPSSAGASAVMAPAPSFQDASQASLAMLSDNVVAARLPGVPEPSTAALMLSALLGLGFTARRRRA